MAAKPVLIVFFLGGGGGGGGVLVPVILDTRIVFSHKKNGALNPNLLLFKDVTH